MTFTEVISFTYADVEWYMNPPASAYEAMKLELSHITNLHAYNSMLSFLQSSIVDAETMDEEGIFSYTDLDEWDRDLFLRSYLPSIEHLTGFLLRYLKASDLPPEVKEELETRSRIRHLDPCECPCCVMDSKGEFKEPTRENREQFKCKLKDLKSSEASLYYSYLAYLSDSDILQYPYRLFRAYQIITLPRWEAEHKAASEMRRKANKAKIEDRKREIRKARGIPQR